jgi:hypothetical protein
MTRQSEHTMRRRVNFYESDPAGIVHFSNYYRYMEEAEHAFWRATGLALTAVHHLGVPRVAAAFKYRKFKRPFPPAACAPPVPCPPAALPLVPAPPDALIRKIFSVPVDPWRGPRLHGTSCDRHADRP